MPIPTMSTSSMRGFRLRAREGYSSRPTDVDVAPSSSRYQTVGKCLDRGLKVLETRQGFDALQTLARRIIEGRWSKRQPCLYDRRDLGFSQMPQLIEWFLRKLRRNFPDVYIIHTEGEASTERFTWATDSSSLMDWIPRDAGKMNLNALVSDS